MRKKIITILFSFFIISVVAQETNPIQLIKGKIIDASTNEGIAYTNIGIEGTFYGTASNDEGEFELKIPAEFQNMPIYFSAVGYKNKVFPVSGLFGQEFSIIKLEEKSYNIGDIDISAQSKVLIRILRTASENISKNYFNQPSSLNCSYEYEKKEDSLTWKMNANVRIDDLSGYSKPSKKDAFSNRNYQFLNVQKNYESYSFKNGTTLLDEIIELDFARSLSSILNPNLLNKFQLNMVDETVVNNNAVWIIGFRMTDPLFEGTGDFYATSFEGKVYINKNNYSILKLECWVKAPKQNSFNRGLAIGDKTNFIIKDVVYDFSVTYDLKSVKFISLNKVYSDGGKAVSEHSQLIVDGINPISGKPINTRDYYEGK